MTFQEVKTLYDDGNNGHCYNVEDLVDFANEQEDFVRENGEGKIVKSQFFSDGKWTDQVFLVKTEKGKFFSIQGLYDSYGGGLDIESIEEVVPVQGTVVKVKAASATRLIEIEE